MHKYARGFTILESLTTMAIASVLSMAAGSLLVDYVEKQKVEAAAYSTLRLVYSARKSAVTSGNRTTFCGVDTHNRCSRLNIQRWAVFHDENNNHQVDDTDSVEWLGQPDFDGAINLKASGQSYMVFNNDGSLRQWGSIVFCAPSGNVKIGQRISLNRSGRPYLVRPSIKKGFVTQDDGTKIQCQNANTVE